MTPAARVQTTIELLDQMLEGNAPEKVLTGWARKSRFAGSKDRAAIRSFFFDALRCKRSYAAYGGALTGRGLMLGLLKDQQIDPQNRSAIDQYLQGAGSESNISGSGVLVDSFA